MWRFISFRLLQAIPVILAVITVTFFLVRMAPGGPFDSEKAVMPEVKAALEAQYRLDQPLFTQYTAYLGDLAQGEFGPSFKYPGRSVNELIAAGVTSILNFAPTVLSVPSTISVRKVDLAVELQILSYYEQRRATAAPASGLRAVPGEPRRGVTA